MINLDPAFQIVTTSVLEQRHHLQEFSALSIRFPAALPEYPTGRSELLGKCMNFWNCLHKVNWVTPIVQEMQKSRKGSPKLVFVGALLALLAMLVWSLTAKIWFE